MDKTTLESACSAEPFGYIVKPFQECDLVVAIETAICRYRAEERLRKMERWLATTLRSIDDAVIATDRGGLIIFLNPKAEVTTGWTLSEALGRPIAEVFCAFIGLEHQPLSGLVQCSTEKARALQLPDHIVLQARNGEEIPIDGSTAPICDASGETTGAIIVYRDKSTRIRAEKEKRRVEDRMRQAQKLESLGLITGSIAHDFNNLLTVVRLNIELLDQGLPTDATERNMVREIRLASEQGAQLCRQMLAYVGKGLRVNSVFDLGQLARDMVPLLRISVSEPADFQVSIPPGLPEVWGDQNQIQQVIMNLVINASESLGHNPGQIRIDAGTEFVAADTLNTAVVACKDCKEGEYVFLDIADTGCGMTSEVVAQIFDPFFTTKFFGRGLGLAAVSGIVRAHKGALTVQSTVGVGTRFRLLLSPAAARS